MTSHRWTPTICAILSWTALLQAQAVRAAPVLTPVVQASAPVYLTHVGDERLFIVEQAGRIRIFDRVRRIMRPAPFLDIRSKVLSGGERGLLSMAFHPDYAMNGLFYVYYTDSGGDIAVERYRVTADRNAADPASAKLLLHIPHPFSNHNGGQMQIGPDGYLYIGTGDGGSAGDPGCRAQRRDSLLGKLLRLDVRQNPDTAPYYGIPADNPFLGNAAPNNEIPDEIWAFGLRNPWRFSFAPSGDLYIADVGQDRIEEIDVQRAGTPGGANFGWKVMEGNSCFGRDACPNYVPQCEDPSLVRPVHQYQHQSGDCSITGGYVYRGDRVPELTGAYVFGDFCSGDIRALREVSPGQFQSTPVLDLNGAGLTTFGEDSSGSLYVAVNNQISELVSQEPTRQVFAGMRKNGVEWIVNLGSHDSFPPAGITLDLAALPAAFGGTLLGAELIVVGVFDPDHAVPVPGAPAPVLRANLMFGSADGDPSVLTNDQLDPAFELLAHADASWIRRWRQRLPVRFGNGQVPVTDPESLLAKLQGNNFGGAFPFSIAVPIVDDRTLLPVFGAAAAVGGLPSEYNVAFPLQLRLDGRLEPVTPDDLKSETLAVFTKNDTELIVHLGSHDDLPGAPRELGALVPAAFGPDGLAGAQVALVGFFDEYNPQQNLMFSRASLAADELDEAQIRAAFELLSGPSSPPALGFVDRHSDLAPGQGRVLPVSDPASFQTMFGCNAKGLPGFGSAAASLCVPIAAATSTTIPLVGAAAGPREFGHVQDVTLTLPGTLSATVRP